MQRFILRFSVLLLSFLSFALNSQTTIADARLQGVNASVTIKGVITNGSELGLIRYIEDVTGGLAIYSSNFAGQLNRGDSVEVTGTIVDYNGLFELNPVTAVNSFGTTALPNPQVISPAMMDETFESELVRLNNVIFNNGGEIIVGNTSYTFSNGVDQSTIYVRNGSPLVGQLLPYGMVDIVGICSQYSTFYQLLPRDISDFIQSEGITITTPISVSNILQESITLNWLTNVSGDSQIYYGYTPALEQGYVSDNALTTTHSLQLTGLDPGTLFYVQIASSLNGDTAIGPIEIIGTQSLSAGWMRAYFNHPVDTLNGINLPNLAQFNTLDDSLISYINNAELSLDLTIYDFDNTNISSISAAINAAHNRGVRVRMISDGNQFPTNGGISDLLPSIPQILSPVGGNYSIMHNKFVVIDANHTDPLKPIVWTGSTNWTDRQINRDPNNVIILQDQTLARTYQLEFEEMWGSSGPDADTSLSRFGPDKLDNTPHQFIIGGHEVSCYFSPSDNTNQKLAEAIASANDSLHFATMLITRFDLAAAIDTAVAHGVNTQGYINDASTTTVFSDISASMGNSLHVNTDTTIIMHHKFCVVDAGIENGAVWTGSHNWSTNATTRNDENSLFIKNAELADWYRRAFTRVVYPISIDSTAGIAQVNTSDISVFPTVLNTNNQLSIRAKSDNYLIQLISSDGKLIQQEKAFISEENTWKTTIKCGTPGIYILLLNGEVYSGQQKLIIQ